MYMCCTKLTNFLHFWLHWHLLVYDLTPVGWALWTMFLEVKWCSERVGLFTWSCGCMSQLWLRLSALPYTRSAHHGSSSMCVAFRIREFLFPQSPDALVPMSSRPWNPAWRKNPQRHTVKPCPYKALLAELGWSCLLLGQSREMSPLGFSTGKAVGQLSRLKKALRCFTVGSCWVTHWGNQSFGANGTCWVGSYAKGNFYD